MRLFEPSMSHATAVLVAVLGLCAARCSARLIARGLRDARPLELVRGLRACILALVAGIGAVGLWSAEPGFLTIGLIILGEELYETGVLFAVIRLGEGAGRTGS
jgi:hypothetical protein